MIHHVNPFPVASRQPTLSAPTPKHSVSNEPSGDFHNVLQQSQASALPTLHSITTLPKSAPMLNPTGNPTLTATPAPAPVTGSGSVVRSDGGVTYTAANNQCLQSNPTGTDLYGNPVALNPNYYATLQAAAQFARAFGGTVLQDPNSTFIAGPTQWAVRLPNGTTVNAGAIAQILGNDAAYANDRIKSAALANAFGLEWSGENFAASARAGESIANATAAPVANPAALTGKELAYYQANHVSQA